MERHNKTYGFTIAIKELRETVPNIFRYASAFKRNRNITSQGLWEMFVDQKKPKEEKEDKKKKDKNYKPLPEEIMSTEPGKGNLDDIDPNDMEGEAYNMCHFWSNFEIARLDWFRSKEYNDFFQMMDRSGGFWMERVSSFSSHEAISNMNSGEMHQFTLSQLERSLESKMFTTSVTLATDIPRFSIVRRMRKHDNPSICHSWSHSWRAIR
jgi:mannosyltransferase